MLTKQITLKPKDRKLSELGPEVRVEAARLRPGAEDPTLERIIRSEGLADTDRDGLREQSASAKTMWLGPCTPESSLEFDLAQAVPLSAVEVWNFNVGWNTAAGIRKADLAISPDGTTWETVLRGAEFAEAEGTDDYDEPVVLKLNGVTARKVRLENITPWGTSGKVGLSKVVFHQAK